MTLIYNFSVSCEYSNEPSDSIEGKNFLTSWATVSFTR